MVPNTDYILNLHTRTNPEQLPYNLKPPETLNLKYFDVVEPLKPL